ncbi:peptidase associated/transthyretin-like domain-containing protein [Kaistella palustris]|uniref:hypothetical protein n=1 Tax=Kaistella palustris TaxID=493376 RepID=UPI0004045A80|nr:hypothetical protein [Kaistella palustris]
MTQKLLILFFFITSLSLFSQEYIFGKVSSELSGELPGVIILNVRTDEKTLTDKDGNFMVAARNSDELRFIKNNFDRLSVKITAASFSQPLLVSLEKSPFLIEEVELAYHVSGILKKDVKALDAPTRVTALNSSLSAYMLRPPTEAAPALSTPSAFAPRNYSAGQINMIGLASAVAGLLRKIKDPPLTTAKYAETQAFYRRIKTTLDLSFYTNRGFDEEEIDRFLIYADQSYSLAKKYRKDFNIAAITADMLMAYQEYIKTHKVGS